MTQEALFGAATAATDTDPEPRLSADQRRTMRQHRDAAAGIHPLTRFRTHPDAARTCGNCRFRTQAEYHNRTYPKCGWTPPTWSAEDYETRTPPRMSHSATSDVRAWWPGCQEHEYGDPKLSPDAARCVPDGA